MDAEGRVARTAGQGFTKYDQPAFEWQEDPEERPVLLSLPFNGKTIEVIADGTFGMLRIHFKEGGQLPKEFDGFFTTPTEARRAITAYTGRMDASAKGK